ncbi:neuronal acetylcholine receptor subunit alpha-10-like [Neocloeon triangulifer]|uniref:neuronal acetylcholine receptor subunit alpha-10-like n=1 Tax=Neocloeon triangulifer TaxID=2078957 RepID=UPI00286EB67C|nr:neuronal acetylcholine receptor subunit alpha-10-like [Neocloeon triangulifer]
MNGLLPFLLLPILTAAHTTRTGVPKLWNYTTVDKLKHELLADYDKFTRPSHHTNTTVVTIDLNLKHIDLDEMSSILTVYAWAKMLWNDDKLKWNASDYENLETLHLADHEVWQPDITLYNSAQGSEVDHYGNTHCIVQHDGQVLWVPPAEFHAFCQIDLHYWPFDTQTCTLMLGSWTYDGEQIDLQLDDGDSVLEMMNNNSQWEIMGVQKQRNLKYYNCCPEAYIDVTYTLQLRRRSEAYRTVVITPATVVVLLTLATFLLPSHAGEKIILNGLTAVIICILLLSFSERLPEMAYRPPLIILFYGSCLTMVALALIESVVVIRISKNTCAHPLPWFIKQALSGWLGSVLLLGPLPSMQPTNLSSIGEEMRDHAEDQHDQQHIIGRRTSSPVNLSHRDWLMFASAIDRAFFIIYLFVFLILFISFHV